MRVLNKTSNGQVTFCPHHNHYHLEFGNVFVHLSPDELRKLRQYVESIDSQYYFELNSRSLNMRKLLLNIGPRNIQFALNPNEFNELKRLLVLGPNDAIISNREFINFESILN